MVTAGSEAVQGKGIGLNSRSRELNMADVFPPCYSKTKKRTCTLTVH